MTLCNETEILLFYSVFAHFVKNINTNTHTHTIISLFSPRTKTRVYSCQRRKRERKATSARMFICVYVLCSVGIFVHIHGDLNGSKMPSNSFFFSFHSFIILLLFFLSFLLFDGLHVSQLLVGVHVCSRILISNSEIRAYFSTISEFVS